MGEYIKFHMYIKPPIIIIVCWLAYIYSFSLPLQALTIDVPIHMPMSSSYPHSISPLSFTRTSFSLARGF